MILNSALSFVNSSELLFKKLSETLLSHFRYLHRFLIHVLTFGHFSRPVYDSNFYTMKFSMFARPVGLCLPLSRAFLLYRTTTLLSTTFLCFFKYFFLPFFRRSEILFSGKNLTHSHNRFDTVVTVGRADATLTEYTPCSLLSTPFFIFFNIQLYPSSSHLKLRMQGVLRTSATPRLNSLIVELQITSIEPNQKAHDRSNVLGLHLNNEYNATLPNINPQRSQLLIR